MLCAIFANAALADHPRLLLTAGDIRAHGEEWQSVPKFAASLQRIEARLRAHFANPPEVPVPVDPGGGYTHEQHKRNGIVIQEAGFLHQWTGRDEFAQYAKQLLLAYASMYPTLGNHPAAKAQSPGGYSGRSSTKPFGRFTPFRAMTRSMTFCWPKNAKS